MQARLLAIMAEDARRGHDIAEASARRDKEVQLAKIKATKEVGEHAIDAAAAPGIAEQRNKRAIGITLFITGSTLAVAVGQSVDPIRHVLVAIIDVLEPDFFPDGAWQWEDAGWGMQWMATAINGIIQLLLTCGVAIKQILLMLIKLLQGLVATGQLGATTALHRPIFKMKREDLKI